MLKTGVFFVFLFFVPIGGLGETVTTNTVDLPPSNVEHVELSLTSNKTIVLTGFSEDQLVLYVLENENYNKWFNQSSFDQIQSQFINQSFEIELKPEVTTNYRLHIVFVNFSDQIVQLNYAIAVDDVRKEKLSIETWLPFLSLLFMVIGTRRKKTTFGR